MTMTPGPVFHEILVPGPVFHEILVPGPVFHGILVPDQFSMEFWSLGPIFHELLVLDQKSMKKLVPGTNFPLTVLPFCGVAGSFLDQKSCKTSD